MSTEMPGTLISATVGKVGRIRGVWGERATEGVANATKRIMVRRDIETLAARANHLRKN